MNSAPTDYGLAEIAVYRPGYQTANALLNYPGMYNSFFVYDPRRAMSTSSGYLYYTHGLDNVGSSGQYYISVTIGNIGDVATPTNFEANAAIGYDQGGNSGGTGSMMVLAGGGGHSIQPIDPPAPPQGTEPPVTPIPIMVALPSSAPVVPRVGVTHPKNSILHGISPLTTVIKTLRVATSAQAATDPFAATGSGRSTAR